MSTRTNAAPEPKVHIPVDHPHAIRLSNRQYSMLKYLSAASRQTLGIEEVSHLNQLTLGANKRRGWLTETPDRHGVQLTWEGKEALRSFEHGDFMRQVARMKFSSYLSLDVYDDDDGSTNHRPVKARAKAVPRRKITRRGNSASVRTNPAHMRGVSSVA